MLVFVLINININMKKIFSTFINIIEKTLNVFLNLNKLNLKQSIKNNYSLYKKKLFSNRILRYKLYIYMYVFITMTLCPYLDNNFNIWYDNESNNILYMIFSLFFLNYILNFFMEIPTKNTFDFKKFFLNLKSFFLYLNSFFIKFLKLFFFLKNEFWKKSFLYIFFKNFFLKLSNFFTYWKPLFKRFSYFGFLKLTKSKFYKNNK